MCKQAEPTHLSPACHVVHVCLAQRCVAGRVACLHVSVCSMPDTVLSILQHYRFPLHHKLLNSSIITLFYR